VYKEVLDLPEGKVVKNTVKNIFTKGSLPSLALIIILSLLTVIDLFTKFTARIRKRND
jgi:hypothetical protein